MISNPEKHQIRMLIQQPQWQAVERVIKEICEKINEEKSSKETEWETIKNILNKEGQIEGIRRLQKELFDQAAQ